MPSPWGPLELVRLLGALAASASSSPRFVPPKLTQQQVTIAVTSAPSRTEPEVSKPQIPVARAPFPNSALWWRPRTP